MTPLTDWLAPSILVGILGLALGLWRWVVAELRQVKSDHVEVDSALRGYKGQGGALHDIEQLKRDVATVDERITKSRHDVRNAIQIDVMKLEEGIHEHFQTFERHLDQRLADLGVGRSKTGG